MSGPAPLPIEIQPWQTRDNGIPHYSHKQWIYRFPNGYGASVIQGTYTYGGSAGLYELGVITFDGDKWGLTYDTPITNDVIGHLAIPDVAELLDRIAALEATS